MLNEGDILWRPSPERAAASISHVTARVTAKATAAGTNPGQRPVMPRTGTKFSGLPAAFGYR